MLNSKIGEIIMINGHNITIKVTYMDYLKSYHVREGKINYITIGCLLGARLCDGRIAVMSCDQIESSNNSVFINASFIGTYDELSKKYNVGINNYPTIGEETLWMDSEILKQVFESNNKKSISIGKYFYDNSIDIKYNPNILFGKHLGIFGNTGTGKTCTVASIIQNYLNVRSSTDIKYIILDVNGEYKTAFNENIMEYIKFDDLRFPHNILSIPEYSRLLEASAGTQYPCLKDCITELRKDKSTWKINDLLNKINDWIETKGSITTVTSNNLRNWMSTMILRIDSIIHDRELIKIIDNDDNKSTIERIKKSNKKVFVLDVTTSADTLDVILFILFKSIYANKVYSRNEDRIKSHLCLVLEEAHRYINYNISETKLGNYFIDKLTREGRKFNLGLIICSQVPSLLSDEIISQCNSVIIHKITNKKDNEFLKGVLKYSSNSLYYQMNSLERQYAIVCGEAFQNDTLVRINNAFPLPSSFDPDYL